MKHGKLSDETLALIARFRTNGVLQDLDTHRIDQSKGAIIVSCADGDQIHDLFHHHEQLFNDAGISPRIHTLALNGGALLVAAGSPLTTWMREDEVLLKNIGVARQLKEIDTVILYAHAPCGAAGAANMTFHNVLEYLMQAKTRLKRIDDKIKVACFCHIDYGDGKKRTYFVSRECFEKFNPNAIASLK